MKAKDKIIKEINNYNWDNVEKVIKTIIPNIIFSVDEQKSNPNLLDSRFGGKPAAPSDFVWPVQSLTENSPLAFFFQLNFEQIKPFDVDNVFPDKGILLCFASVTGDVMWEYDVKDAFKTYFFEDSNDLVFTEIPTSIPAEQQLVPRIISYSSSYQLPRYPFNYKLRGLLSDEDADGIDDVANAMFDESYTARMQMKMSRSIGRVASPVDDSYKFFSHNLLLGVPFSVQHTIAEVWNEQYFGEEEAYENDESTNYVNLISFEMKGEDGYGFSRNGAHLYLCMHKEDLKNKDFSKIINVVQNT